MKLMRRILLPALLVALPAIACAQVANFGQISGIELPLCNSLTLTNGFVLTYNGSSGCWNAQAGSSGTGSVTSVSVVTANGYSGTVATATTTPAITISGPAIPSGANPSASIGLSAVNGVATTFMASDSAPALSQAIVPTWTGLHTFSSGITLSAASALGTPSAINLTHATALPAAALPALTGAVTSSAGSATTAIAAAIAVPQIIPTSVWASRGSGTFTGQLIRITDVGPANVGTTFVWDNTASVWKLTQETDVSYDITIANAPGGAVTSEQIPKQATIPIGLLQSCRTLVIRTEFAKTGTTNAMTSAQIRIGTAGTTSDTSVAGTGGLTAGNRTMATETWYAIQSTTDLRALAALASTSGWSVIASSTAWPKDITVADISANALIVSATTTMAGTTDTGQVAALIVHLIP
jgi:hypothetical protein